ncbi:Phage integrase family protein (fragment) [Candidatus Sulfopaludibacter sp. SbA3]
MAGEVIDENLAKGCGELHCSPAQLGIQAARYGHGTGRFRVFPGAESSASYHDGFGIRAATQPRDHQPSDWARRRGFVRVFARHWSATDPHTEIPADGLLPFRAQRAHPHLYTDKEIQKLLAAAKKLSPIDGLRPCLSLFIRSFGRRGSPHQ